MKGKNEIKINQLTMLEAINLWLADKFKIPPVATDVSSDNSISPGSFTIKIDAPEDEGEKQ